MDTSVLERELDELARRAPAVDPLPDLEGELLGWSLTRPLWPIVVDDGMAPDDTDFQDSLRSDTTGTDASHSSTPLMRTSSTVAPGSGTAAADGPGEDTPEWQRLLDPLMAEVRLEPLRAALTALGVDEALTSRLVDVAAAAVTVSTPAVTSTAESQSRNEPQTPNESQSHNKLQSFREPESGGATPPAASSAASSGSAPLAKARGQELLSAVLTLTRATAHLEAVALAATRELTAATGHLLLADKGATSPEELTSAQRDAWRSKAKSAAKHELAPGLGWGQGEVSDLVALANTSHMVIGPVTRALTTGEAPWRLARRYFRACSALDTADAAAIANALFGDDASNAVTERINSAGHLTGAPWVHAEFYRALDREVRKITSRDPEKSKKTREQNLAANDVRSFIDRDGTAAITIGCTPTQAAAISDRIERAAKAARRGGDLRTLPQLRTALGAALLLHGTLDLSDLPDKPGLITIEQTEQLTKLLHGLPAAQVNLIVPLNTLLGTTPTGLLHAANRARDAAGQVVDGHGNPVPVAFTGANARANGGSTSLARTAACTCRCTCRDSAGELRPPPASSDNSSGGLRPRSAFGDSSPGELRLPPAFGDNSTGGLRPPPPDPGELGADGEVGVGEVVLGSGSVFLTPQECRALALTPGSTFYRLVTDPITGALLERSTTAYKFDKAMRAHIIYADVFCRAPGCLKPALLSQIDHVQEHGTPGGHTCVRNGQAAHEPHHDLKTKKLWDAILHENRDVTWTTLLGRIYTTKAHDYTQYTRLLRAATLATEQAIAAAKAAGGDPDHVIDDAIYQALSYRPRGAPLESDDEWHDFNDSYHAWDTVTLTHTPGTGQRTYRPDPEVIRAEATRMRNTRDTDDQGRGAEPHGDDEHTRDRADEWPSQQHPTADGQNAQNRTKDWPIKQRRTDDGQNRSPWSRDPDEPPPF